MSNSTQIIAEVGVNHNGSLECAKELIHAAKSAGADFVKFQTFSADRLAKRNTQLADYQIKQLGTGASQHEMLQDLELSKESHFELKELANSLGLPFISTPFDLESLHFLVEEISVPVIKIGSGDLTFGPMLFESARFGLPIYISTGMSTLSEILDALKVLEFGYGIFIGDLQVDDRPTKMSRESYWRTTKGANVRERITIFHCTSAYPAPLSKLNLRALNTIKTEFGCKVGYSDHSIGSAVAPIAIALGAIVIEKHITLDKSMHGPDHAASLDPYEFGKFVETCQVANEALGSEVKEPQEIETKTSSLVRRGIWASEYISSGSYFSENNLEFLRPVFEMSPMDFWDLEGSKATRSFEPGEGIGSYER